MRWAFCTIRLASTRIDIVDIPVTQDGALYVDERHTLYELRNAAFTAADNAETANRATFETAEEYVGKYDVDVDGDVLTTNGTPYLTDPDGA